MLAKSPDRKRAVEYLAACGVVPITVIERDGVCSIHVGIAGPVSGRWWLAAQDAARVAARARRLAGKSPDLAQPAIAAVQRSATALGATLTPDDVAIRRAGDSMKRLDATVEQMRRNGTLRILNAGYKAGRGAAAAGATATCHSGLRRRDSKRR
jgi:hypothetical protein